jgi:hypothetical protein
MLALRATRRATCTVHEVASPGVLQGHELAQAELLDLRHAQRTSLLVVSLARTPAKA